MQRTFIGWALIAFSWSALFIGAILGGIWCAGSWEKYSVVLLTGAVVAVVFRFLANIGDFIFNIKIYNVSIVKSLSIVVSSLNQMNKQDKIFQESVGAGLKSLNDVSLSVNNSLSQTAEQDKIFQKSVGANLKSLNDVSLSVDNSLSQTVEQDKIFQESVGAGLKSLNDVSLSVDNSLSQTVEQDKIFQESVGAGLKSLNDVSLSTNNFLDQTVKQDKAFQESVEADLKSFKEAFVEINNLLHVFANKNEELKQLLGLFHEDVRTINGNSFEIIRLFQELSIKHETVNSELRSLNDNFLEAKEITTSDLGLLKERFLEVVDLLGKIINNTQIVDQTLQQINCDSQDVNQNLHKLTAFLEEIEKHLDLKK